MLQPAGRVCGQHLQLLRTRATPSSGRGIIQVTKDALHAQKQVSEAGVCCLVQLGHSCDSVWLHAGALEAYEQSLLAAPECSTVYGNKAATLAKLERHNDAIAAAYQALQINSNYEKVLAMFGCLCRYGKH